MAKLTARVRAARKKPGGSNVGQYPNVKKSDFAGPAGGAPAGSFPINTRRRGVSALKEAHNAPNPAGIKKAVYKKYPSLSKQEETTQPKRATKMLKDNDKRYEKTVKKDDRLEEDKKRRELNKDRRDAKKDDRKEITLAEKDRKKDMRDVKRDDNLERLRKLREEKHSQTLEGIHHRHKKDKNKHHPFGHDLKKLVKKMPKAMRRG